jgi:uncharacterized repeat protein (TIGR03847 family)
MADEVLDLGPAELIGADAVGMPGGRRFRLFARSLEGSASLWIEREQLEDLATAIYQLLAAYAHIQVLRPVVQVGGVAPPGPPSDFPAEPDADFRVGQLQISFEEERGIVLQAEPLKPFDSSEEPDEETEKQEFSPQLATSISAGQAQHLGDQILAVLASGRPRCPLCGQPMQPQHVCEKQNGFHPVKFN